MVVTFFVIIYHNGSYFFCLESQNERVLTFYLNNCPYFEINASSLNFRN